MPEMNDIFDCDYLIQFLVNFRKHGQFRNTYKKQMSKLLITF